MNSIVSPPESMADTVGPVASHLNVRFIDTPGPIRSSMAFATGPEKPLLPGAEAFLPPLIDCEVARASAGRRPTSCEQQPDPGGARPVPGCCLLESTIWPSSTSGDVSAGTLFNALYSELHGLAKAGTGPQRRFSNPERDNLVTRSISRYFGTQRRRLPRSGTLHGICGPGHARNHYRLRA